ncbi:hypothetical protein WH91_12470 [Devosia psychrophila]|uniref:Uncharacterized protein n=1 Tax=Devosia psychrophila TaxID=728005 RepID=A0ABR5DX98_9HYPH|nr:hypothetical protein WH91_12470 [Devosia psychrophila]
MMGWDGDGLLMGYPVESFGIGDGIVRSATVPLTTSMDSLSSPLMRCRAKTPAPVEALTLMALITMALPS